MGSSRLQLLFLQGYCSQFTILEHLSLFLLVARGASQSGNTSDAVALLEQLKQRRVELEDEEKRLEELYGRMKHFVKSMDDDDSDDDQYPHIITGASFRRGEEQK